MIVDWTEFSFKQSTKLSPKMLKMIVEGLQVSRTENDLTTLTF